MDHPETLCYSIRWVVFSCVRLQSLSSSCGWRHPLGGALRASHGKRTGLALVLAKLRTWRYRKKARHSASFSRACSQRDRATGRRPIQAFEQAVAADPASPLLRERLAVLYVRESRLVDALEQCRTAVENDPENLRTRHLLGGIFSSLNRHDEAIAEYQTILALDPDDQEAYLLLGTLYAKRGQFEPAIEDAPATHAAEA